MLYTSFTYRRRFTPLLMNLTLSLQTMPPNQRRPVRTKLLNYFNNLARPSAYACLLTIAIVAAYMLCSTAAEEEKEDANFCCAAAAAGLDYDLDRTFRAHHLPPQRLLLLLAFLCLVLAAFADRDRRFRAQPEHLERLLLDFLCFRLLASAGNAPKATNE
ncbi:hypothetical protein AK812_SmicGene6470 [Symbiodinium microadriaticum]|uniref:Uncharacterized protein n=1 Tax=Symbiodinium microadriaticum TaxID=2951 RepID=A0A1Q9ER64_SYMMI|nr:hypothetical protein AK812_SmicGene6470 [Symbiodinium microadriaticum]CAE7941875.1 unnamed protein product [Symbiodinium sp. KB8]